MLAAAPRFALLCFASCQQIGLLLVVPCVSQVLPPLGSVIGTGKPLNCLVTNKWRNAPEIQKITQLPMLLMASVHVSQMHVDA
jgi:hypothetical protein